MKDAGKLNDREIEMMAVLAQVIKGLNQAFPGNGEGPDDEFIVRYLVGKMTFDVSESDQLKVVNKMRTLERGLCPKETQQKLF